MTINMTSTIKRIAIVSVLLLMPFFLTGCISSSSQSSNSDSFNILTSPSPIESSIVTEIPSPKIGTSVLEGSNNISPQTENNQVKMSKTGICHAPGTTYYERTKSFTAFKTVDECLASGGRMPER